MDTGRQMTSDIASEPFVKEPPVALTRDRKSGIIGDIQDTRR